MAAHTTVCGCISLSRKVSRSPHHSRSRTAAPARPHQQQHQRRAMHHRHQDNQQGKEAVMTCHSNNYFDNHQPTGWKQPQFPNTNPRLPNRVWRKQSK